MSRRQSTCCQRSSKYHSPLPPRAWTTSSISASRSYEVPDTSLRVMYPCPGLAAKDSTADAITVISFFGDRVRITMKSVPTRVIIGGAGNPLHPYCGTLRPPGDANA